MFCFFFCSPVRTGGPQDGPGAYLDPSLFGYLDLGLFGPRPFGSRHILCVGTRRALSTRGSQGCHFFNLDVLVEDVYCFAQCVVSERARHCAWVCSVSAVGPYCVVADVVFCSLFGPSNPRHPVLVITYDHGMSSPHMVIRQGDHLSESKRIIRGCPHV